jgi:predicted phage baseplate assembly protein
MWRVDFDRLQRPSADLLERVAAYLDERRVLGTRLIVEPPRYRGVTVVAHLHAQPGSDPVRVRKAAIGAVNRYLHPIVGGPDGGGWPFGRTVQQGELSAVLQGVSGVEIVDELRLFPADPITRNRDIQQQRIELADNALVYSFEPQIRVS